MTVFAILLAGFLFAKEKVLLDIEAKVAQNAREGKTSYILSDLDETLVDSHQTRLDIFFELIKQKCPKEKFEAPCEKARGISARDVYRSANGYNLQKIFKDVGFNLKDPDEKAFVEDLFAQLDQKLTDGYVVEDRDNTWPGAVPYFRALIRSGAKVIFASNRQENLKKFTEHSLDEFGLKAEGIWLRQKGESGIAAKTRFAESVAKLAAESKGEVIGLFENEPRNLKIWMEKNPQALGVLVAGNQSVSPGGKELPAPKGAHTIQTYR